MKYGYIRPIIQDQDFTHQLNQVVVDQLFKEKHGLAKKRSVLEHLLMNIQK